MLMNHRAATLVLLSLTINVANAAPAPALTVEKVVAKVQKLYDGTTDFSARFEQTYEMKAMGRSSRSEGRVAFQRPGRIRFDYATPMVKTYAVEGTTLWVFQPEDGQALVDRCFKADGLTASLVFLGGSGRIVDQFTTQLVTADDASYGLQLVPRTPQQTYQTITLWVDRKTYEVRKTVVEDAQGNPNTFVFLDVRRNKGVKKTDVVFAPPPGVNVNPVPGSCVTGQ